MKIQDLTKCEYFLWVYVKNELYKVRPTEVIILKIDKNISLRVFILDW